MKKITLLLFFGLLLAGCAKESITNSIVFHAEVNDVNAFTAQVTVTHNATNRDVYYVFVADGAVSDLNQEIADFISQETPEQLEKYAHNQRKSVFMISGLAPESTFTLIVFGMKNDGNLYGKPYSIVFNTPETNLEAELNPNWDIRYLGYQVYNDSDYSKITVDVSGEVEERYFITTFPVEVVRMFNDIESLIVQATHEFLESIKYQTDSDFWLDNRFVLKGDVSYYTYLQEGDYVAYAIGISANGSPTGHYAETSCFHVDKYPPTEGYASLLGIWSLTGSTDKTYHLLIVERVVNKSVDIIGWGNFAVYSIAASFDRKDNSIKIPPQIIEKEMEITFSDGLIAKGELTLRGVYYNSQDKLEYLTSVSPLTIGKLDDNGDYIFTSAFLSAFGGSMSEEKTGLSYYIDRKEDNNIGFARLMFPFVMTKYKE